MSRTDRVSSASARKLAEYMATDASTAALAAQGITRTDAWRYATGRVVPLASKAAALARLGIPADGWEPDPPPAEGVE